MDLFNLSAILTLDTSKYEQGISKAEAVAKGMDKAFKLGAAAIGGATVAVGAFGAASVKTGMSFDTAMSQVGATMLKTNEEMAQSFGEVDTAYGHFSGNLRDFAKFLGANTAFSATQAAEALNYMALAGYDTQQSMDMLPNVMSLAAAGAMDLARASDMVTDTQTAFGISAERTSQMVDEMAKAASTGNTSVEQLGDAFLVVGGLAKELNGGMVTLADGTQAPVDGLQEMEIALTAMANAGIKGSEAGTHMRNMIMKLSSPTSDGAKQMEALGVSVFDAEGKMRSLSDIFGDLNGALGNLTQEQKIQAISDLFNARDLASAEALLGAIESDWDGIGASILNSEGAAADMANIQLDNLAGDITLFKSALEGAQITISDVLSPSLREFVQFGTQGISELSTAFEQGGLSGAMDSLGGILADGLSMILSGVPSFLNAGLELLGALAEGLIENAPAFLEAGEEVVTMLGERFMEIAPQIVEFLWNGITTGLPMLTEGAIQIMQTLGDGISQAIPELLPVALNALMEFSGQLRENAGQLVDAGIEMVLKIAQGLIDSLPVIIETVPTIVTNIAGIINDNAPKLIAGGITLIGNLVTGIINAAPTIIAQFPKIVKSIFSVITAVNWLALGGNIIKGIASGIKSLATNIPTALKNIGTQAMQWMKLIQWNSLGRDIIDLIVIGLKALASSIPTALKSIGMQAMTAFKSINWLSLGTNIISGIVSGVTSGASRIADAAKNAAKNAFNAAKNFLGIKSPSRLFRDQVGKMISEGMALGIEDGEGGVLSAIDDLNADLAGGIDDMDYDTSFSVTRKQSRDEDSNANVVAVLEVLLAKLEEMDEGMSDRLLDAFARMKFSISGREFGRLVRDVRTA